MRSVLDMKLGAMALSLDAHLTPEPFAPRLDAPPEVVDAFGIAIPASTQRKMSAGGWQEPVYRKPSDASDADPVVHRKDDTPCSLFLAESPSRLDLSALLC